jgi:hypothetical protein
MRAIARLCWTYGTALPVQRWVGWLALGVWALVLLARALAGPNPLLGLGIIATLMYVLATTFASGYLFRQWSAPRTHLFLPHFRARTLAAFLIVVGAISVPGLALLALPWRPATFTAGAMQILIFNLVAFMTFSPGAGIVVSLLIGAFFALATRVLPAPGPADLPHGNPAAIAFVIWAAVWTGFGVWYLRVRFIGRPEWPPSVIGALVRRFGPRFFSDATGDFSRSSAIASSFTLSYPLDAKHLLTQCALGAALAASLMLLTRGLGTPLGMSFVLFGLSTTSLVIPATANMFARRTRSLWLASGLSRLALFDLTEQLIWKRTLPRSFIAFTILLSLAALLFGLPGDLLARAFLVWISSTVLGAYLGLAEVRGLYVLEVAAGIAFVASVATGLWAAGGAPRYDWLFGTSMFQLVAAATARAIAIARWNRLDWLTFRPVRVPSQSLRAGC